ncbi:hypothetical protein [Streptomyces roseochromogenus]|uniref:Uncharacterized protein n=1 Tax=Streptomyces roseochromogenus subsp. oscitans DS 12.976 TaxID=1352936 RepID=V6JJ57_STRRC|nr:hypothetical protein [Streptomyces roseochromogenus]EST19942.1 hypothetical protein M878_40945 [Streptomyces roseochromogenus subsp. oscitans DS 12.976]
MRALRTLRTTLVAAGATAVLAASAGGAFAATAPESAPAAHAPAHCKDKRVLVKTVRLADKVSVAKVYKTGKHRFEAEIWAKGKKYGTLATKGKGKPVHGRHNGLHVTLHPNGKVTSWVERAKPKPEPKPQPVAKRILVSITTLADDVSTGKVYKLGANHYEADIYAHGVKLDTLVAKGHAAYGENNGLHVALKPDGRLTSWVDDAPQPEPKKNTSDAKPTPLPDNGDATNDKAATPAPVIPATPDAQVTTEPAQAR